MYKTPKRWELVARAISKEGRLGTLEALWNVLETDDIKALMGEKTHSPPIE